MKGIKFTALALALVMIIGMLAGCAGSGSGAGDPANSGTTGAAGESAGSKESTEDSEELTGTFTLSEYLTTGPKVGFTVRRTEPLDKDAKPDTMYLFEDGKVYYVYAWNEYGTASDEDALTWGEIAKMSDEELIEFAQKNKSLHDIDNEVTFTFDASDPAFFANGGLLYFDGLENHEGTFTLTSVSRNRENGIPYVELDVCSRVGDNQWQKEGTVLLGVDGNLYKGSWEVGYYLYNGEYGEIQIPNFSYEYTRWDHEMSTGEYTLHVSTDNTGNSVESEQIRVEMSYDSYDSSVAEQTDLFTIEKYSAHSIKSTVYDSTFTILSGFNGWNPLIFRIGSNLDIVLDDIGAEGVEVD